MTPILRMYLRKESRQMASLAQAFLIDTRSSSFTGGIVSVIFYGYLWIRWEKDLYIFPYHGGNLLLIADRWIIASFAPVAHRGLSPAGNALQPLDELFQRCRFPFKFSVEFLEGHKKLIKFCQVTIIDYICSDEWKKHYSYYPLFNGKCVMYDMAKLRTISFIIVTNIASNNNFNLLTK